MQRMKIGIAKEHRPNEKRVILRPRELKDICAKHEVLVEKDAGKGIGIKDSEYQDIGASVVDKKTVYLCDLVARVKVPTEAEFKLMKPGSVIVSMLQLRSFPKIVNQLKKYKINAIALEKLKNIFGERLVEALHQTGQLGMAKGFELWKGKPENAVVKIMGYGHVSWGAIQIAARKFARVIVLNKKDIYEMERDIPGTDILVNALNWPYELRGEVVLIKQEMLKLFKPGSVIVDLIANPAGQSPIETMHPTPLQKISYKVDGIIHAACWGWPGLDPVNISKRYSIQFAPILLEIANSGIDNLPEYVKKAFFKVKWLK